MEKIFKEELNKFKSLSYMLMPLDIQLFASGTIDGGKYNNYYSYYITWSSTPNTVGNYSDVTANWIMKKTASDPYGAYNSSGSSKVTLYIDTVGSGETTANFDLRSSAVGTTKVLKSWTKRIDHNSDGTRKVKIGGLHKTGLDWGNKEIYDHEVTLDTIPRASDLSVTNGVIGSTATITLGKKSTSFTDSVKIVFGSLTKYLKADGTLSDTEVKLSTNGSINWTVPTSFYAQIPTSKSGKATITSTTYNGTTVVGTKSLTIDILTSESSKAVINTFTAVDTNSATIALTGDANKIVKYLSKPKVTLKATSNTNSTVKSFTIKNADGSGSNGTNTTGTLAIEYTFPNGVESGTFDATVVDGRGYSTYATQLKKTLIEYIKLGFTKLEVKRTEPTSNTITVTVAGNWFNGSFGATTNALANLTWNKKESGSTSWVGGGNFALTKSGNTFTATATLGTNFDYQKSYDFQFILKDSAMTLTVTGTVTKGQAVMLIGDEEVIINGDVTINGSLSVNGLDLENYYLKRYNRNMAVNKLNLDNPDINGLFELRGSELAYTGTKPFNGFMPFLNLKTPDNIAMLQIAGRNGQLYYRTNQAGGVTMNGVNWVRFTDSANSAITLYSNSSGSNGSITLNDDVSKYNFIEIYYQDNNGNELSSKKFINVNNKSISLDLQQISSGTSAYWRSTTYQVSGSTITVSNTQQLGYVRYDNGNMSLTYDKSYIYITKVVGYK